MNSWQNKFIQDNLGSLISVTSCTVRLLACLTSKGILDDEEVQNLTTERKYSGDIQAANKLYSILKTRTEGFFGLMAALKETRQTGAWNIFMSGIKEKLSTFPIKLGDDIMPLNELFTSWTNKDSVECLDSEDTMTEFCQLLSDDDMLMDINKPFLNQKPHPLYIPRYVSNRVIVDAKVFKQTSNDVFAYKGINKYDLVELVDPHPVRSSSDQLTLITCRHIYLDNDEDWDDLRDVANTPIHLISKEDGKYVLQRSTQITDTILSQNSSRHRPKEAYISEQDFAKKILSNQDTKGVCVCDIPGMGKTWYLQSVATKLNTLSKRTLVLFVQVSEFAKGLIELSEYPGDPLNYIIEATCSSNLISRILKCRNLQMILVLDGFDEIREDCVGMITKFLRHIISVDNIRLIISSRPSMRKHLEETFKVISYDILPFGREEQVSAIVGQWQLSIHQRESQLREYAEQCIRLVKDIQCEDSKDILGIPLKCYILADVNLKHAEKIARRKNVLNVSEDAVIKSTCDLYEKFVDSRISKVVEPDSGNMIRRILSFYTHQALMLLMPAELPASLAFYFSENKTKSKITKQLAVKIGIMSLDRNSKFVFFHRSFAEYFVGKFFAEFWKNLDDFDNSFVRSVGDYFVTNVLKRTRRNYNDVIAAIMFRPLGFFTPVDKQKISSFHNRTVLWFMNSMCPTETKIVSRFRAALQSRSLVRTFTRLIFPHTHQPDTNFTHFKMMLENQVFEILITCIDEQFRFILSLFLQIVQVFFDPCERFKIIKRNENGIPVLMYRIAVSGLSETAHEIFDFFSQGEQNYLRNYCDKFPMDFISPLEVSIRRNDADMFAYFFNKVPVPMERLLFSGLLGDKLTSADISKRSDIFGMIIAGNKDKAWTVNVQDLVQYLETSHINKGHDFTKWVGFAFHHNLSLYELPRTNKAVILEIIINELGDVQMFQMLLLFFGRSEILSRANRDERKLDTFPFKAEETLQSLNLTEAKATFALIPQHGFSFFFGSIWNLETLKVLLQICPDFKVRNLLRSNYLHLAAKKGAVDWIEYLVKVGHRVNEKDFDGYTPMFHVNPEYTNFVGVIDALIKNGANIYTVHYLLDNIAHYLLKHGSWNSAGLTKFVEYTLERGYLQLWTMKDMYGTSAYQLLSKKLGESHPLAKAVLSKLNFTSSHGQN